MSIVKSSIAPRETSLYDLLKEESRFRIPRYQRKYSWGNEAVEFLEDIVRSAVESEYFIGPMIFIESGTGANRVYDVIDGQQRMITTSMILAILRDVLWIFGKDGGVWEDIRKRVDGINHLVSFVDYKGDFNGSKILYSYYDEAVLEFIINKGVGELVRSEGNAGDLKTIKSVRKYLKQKLETRFGKTHQAVKTYLRLFELVPRLVLGIEPKDNVEITPETLKMVDAFIQDVLPRVKTVVLLVDNEDSAFQIFESLNDKGLKLGPLDLIKNYILMTLSNSGASEEQIIGTSVRWDELVNTTSDAERYILYYLMVRESRKLSKREMYKVIKRVIKNREDVTKFMGDLEILFNFKSTLKQRLKNAPRDREQISDILSSLEALGVNQHLAILFALLLSPKVNPQEYLKYLKGIYNLALRFKITRTNWNKLERKLGHLVKAINEGNYDDYRAKLQEIMPSDEVVKQAFVEYLITKKQRDTQVTAREVLKHMNNYILSYKKAHHIKPVASLTVEHLIPEVLREKYGEETTNSFGNIVLVDDKLNKKLGTKGLDEKIKILLRHTKQDLPINRIVVYLTMFLEGKLSKEDLMEKLQSLIQDSTLLQTIESVLENDELSASEKKSRVLAEIFIKSTRV